MNARRNPRTMLATLVVIAGVALSACSGNPTSSGAASVGGGGSPTGSAAPTATTAASNGTLAVDLVFTGTFPVTAKGSAGQCMLGHNTADSSILFGFGATEADYPGLGDGFYVNEDPGSHRLVLKWLKPPGFLENLTEGQGFTYSSDHKSITIDVDLQANDPEHLSGTVSCP